MKSVTPGREDLRQELVDVGPVCGSSWARAFTPGPDAAAALSDRPWPPGNLLPDARWLNIMASMDL
jgi:hypothetical protein